MKKTSNQQVILDISGCHAQLKEKGRGERIRAHVRQQINQLESSLTNTGSARLAKYYEAR